MTVTLLKLSPKRRLLKFYLMCPRQPSMWSLKSVSLRLETCPESSQQAWYKCLGREVITMNGLAPTAIKIGLRRR